MDQNKFSRLFWEKILTGKKRGKILEAACGDGLIGSFGWWLEKNADWSAECQEEKRTPRSLLVQFRARAKIHLSLSEMQIDPNMYGQRFDLVTVRALPEILWILRSIRQGNLHAPVVGIWNRTGSSHWSRRMNQMQYRLVLCQNRLEVYRKK